MTFIHNQKKYGRIKQENLLSAFADRPSAEMVEHNESRTEKCKPPTVQRYMALRHRATTVS